MLILPADGYLSVKEDGGDITEQMPTLQSKIMILAQ
jgi:hypothetical protein